MGGGKGRKKPAKIVVVPEGLQIQDEKKFYKDICAALLPIVGPGHLTPNQKPWGQRCMVYIRESNSPLVEGREGPVPALPLFLDNRQSAWLVVELESEYGGGPLVLKHVSLKLWQGSTVETAQPPIPTRPARAQPPSAICWLLLSPSSLGRDAT